MGSTSPGQSQDMVSGQLATHQLPDLSHQRFRDQIVIATNFLESNRRNPELSQLKPQDYDLLADVQLKCNTQTHCVRRGIALTLLGEGYSQWIEIKCRVLFPGDCGDDTMNQLQYMELFPWRSRNLSLADLWIGFTFYQCYKEDPDSIMLYLFFFCLPHQDLVFSSKESVEETIQHLTIACRSPALRLPTHRGRIPTWIDNYRSASSTVSSHPRIDIVHPRNGDQDLWTFVVNLPTGHIYLLALLDALTSGSWPVGNSVSPKMDGRKVPQVLLTRICRPRVCWSQDGSVTVKDLTVNIPYALRVLLVSSESCAQAVVALHPLIRIEKHDSGTDLYTIESTTQDRMSYVLTRLSREGRGSIGHARIDTRFRTAASQIVLHAFPVDASLDADFKLVATMLESILARFEKQPGRPDSQNDDYARAFMSLLDLKSTADQETRIRYRLAQASHLLRSGAFTTSNQKLEEYSPHTTPGSNSADYITTVHAMATLRARNLIDLGRVDEANNALVTLTSQISWSMAQRSSILKSHSYLARLNLTRQYLDEAERHWDESLPDVMCCRAEILRRRDPSTCTCDTLRFHEWAQNLSPLDEFKIKMDTLKCSTNHASDERLFDQISHIRGMVSLMDGDDFETKSLLNRFRDVEAVFLEHWRL
ncbi:hypothetical protein KVT40_001473 [Elsinoe batatas]|uniref:Uncharacterized protein n=1 Tax=Elsinoe batatas TaxID=2601811 RepID=A0A8K0L530_9PEZI|nr:hypothetical protein KVT40_001473 [Elsinoe batatas]